MKKTDDKQLEDYLQGKDGISSAYDQLGQEKPPADLDERILLAARSAIAGQKPAKKAIPYQAYSIAASVCLMVLAATLFLQNEDELTGADIHSRAIPLMDSIEESAFQLEADFNQLAPAEAEIQTAAPAPTAAQAQAEALQLEAQEARQRVITEDGLAAQALEAIENANAQGAAATDLQVFSLEQAGALNNAPQTAQTTAAVPPYRASAESWLAEIQRLQAIEPAQAAEEIRLFALEYPEMDIEAALEALNTTLENN
jgi:hypothetical protein